MRLITRRGRPTSLRWHSAEHLQVGKTHFDLTIDREAWDSADSECDRFPLLKMDYMIDRLVEIAPERVGNVVDLGIFKGGSVALYAELFRPRRLVGIDRLPDRVESLDEFVIQRALSDVVRLYYGTDQGDGAALRRILREEFGDEPLDLVVDDCSHVYGPTKAALNVLLPRLRPGGLYVIEDWGWAHWEGDYWQGPNHPFVDEQTPLSRLILELVMLAASRPALIAKVTVRMETVYLSRGDEVAPDRFDVSASYMSDGRPMLVGPTVTQPRPP
jgi:SAM-dependent methyltransferase